MHLVLVVDEAGVVRGATPTACELLGNGVGRRCWDVVGGLRADRQPVCIEGCAVRLRDLPRLAANHGSVGIRGVDHDLVCTAVGEQVVVRMTPLESRDSILSDRQREVLCCVARGETNEAIAAQLGIGAGTVRTQVQHARSRLGARTRAQAVAIALQRGEIS